MDTTMHSRAIAQPLPRPAHGRHAAIDALRGLMMVFMLLDHVRETFFLHHQVGDPMSLESTSPGLFASRMLAHLCAPVFVFLTGLSACLYGAREANGRAAASSFLFKRGLFLVLLEVSLVNFAWTFQWPPQVVYLQVIWAIGLSMLALSLLVWLPRSVLIGVGLALAAGHNLLDGLHFSAGHALHIPWAVLHDRSWIGLGESLRLRTSYPLLPWIGVIALGYASGPWFLHPLSCAQRQRRMLCWGAGLIAGFAALRAADVYGDKPWSSGGDPVGTAMAFLNLTKYPPSLLFIALTLGVGLLLLRAFDRSAQERDPVWLTVLARFGAAPMFFYLLHLYVLKLLYLAALAFWGPNQGRYFGFEHVWALWLCTPVLATALYPAVRAFGAFKARRRDIAWLRYF